MKLSFGMIMLLSIISLFSACKKDEGKLPNISFKTGPVYISSDVTLATTSVVVIGITASKSEEEDVLKKFTVSKSINGATATTQYSQDLTGAEGDTYSHDYTEVLSGNHGDTIKYTFTVTNRDGLTKQVSLTVTVA